MWVFPTTFCRQICRQKAPKNGEFAADKVQYNDIEGVMCGFGYPAPHH